MKKIVCASLLFLIMTMLLSSCSSKTELTNEFEKDTNIVSNIEKTDDAVFKTDKKPEEKSEEKTVDFPEITSDGVDEELFFKKRNSKYISSKFILYRRKRL